MRSRKIKKKGRQEKSEKGVKEKAAKEATKKAAKAAAAKEAAKEASSKGQASLNPKMTQKPAATVSQSEKKQETKDQYLTDPVPEGKPEPVEPQDVTVTHKAMKCTLSVSCDTILTHMEDLVTEKVSLVPEDGVLFKAQEVTFYEGESVFDVLLREMKNHKIHMEFVNTPIYNSAYIEGMGNLYEFDCGQLSGWMYKVNGWFPNYGCSRYMLQDGDKVEWVYTCDLGRDVGGYIEGMEGE